MTGDMITRLTAYANAIMGNKKICDNQDETVKRIVERQPEIVLEALGISVEPEDGDSKQEERILKYYEMITKTPVDIKKIRGSERVEAYAKQMESVIKSYAKYDYSKEGRIEVNGNTFTYNKDKFDPAPYMDEMAKMGESVQGDIFSISLDEDGKVVIY